MAIRQHTIWPDQVIETPNGEIAMVSDTAFVNGVLRAAQMIPMAGGSLAVAVDRTPTGMPNESVTTLAICEWRTHTDGKPAREPENRSAEKVVAAMHEAVEKAAPTSLDHDDEADARADETVPDDVTAPA